MSENIEKLQEKIKEEEKKLVIECGLVKNDCVEFTNKDKKVEKCRVQRVYGYEGKLVIILRNNDTTSLGWSSNAHHLHDTLNIKKIDEPKINTDTIYEQECELKRERAKITKEIDQKIDQCYKDKKAEQLKCIHIWSDEGVKTGRVIKHMIGETEQEEFECEICEQIGYNA